LHYIAKDVAAIEAKITAAFDEGNKARVDAAKKNEAEKNKKAADRKDRMAQLGAIKEKVTSLFFPPIPLPSPLYTIDSLSRTFCTIQRQI
jgi:hypothetical protein